MPLINGTDVDGIADIHQVTVDLTAAVLGVNYYDDSILARARDAAVWVQVGTETGTVDISINSIEGTLDGTNWVAVVDFGTTYDNLTSEGIKTVHGVTPAELNTLKHCKKLRLNVTDNGTLSGSQKATFLIVLAFQASKN